MAKHPLPVPPGFATGVDGLDEIVRGGLPGGRKTLIIGGPGAGKTTPCGAFGWLSAMPEAPPPPTLPGALSDKARVLKTLGIQGVDHG